MSLARNEAWIENASRILQVPLARHGANEACGPCPFCHAGTDRFIVWQSGNAWCRRCHKIAWWLPKEEAEKAVAQETIKRAERQSDLLLRMESCLDWQTYHDALQGEKFGYWYEHGIADEEIERWGLGYCASCPLVPEKASLTIPVFYRQKLVDIRHRVIGAGAGDKYRSHLAGLTPSLFNRDAVSKGEIVLVVEGEKKAMLSVRAGFPATVGLPGVQFVNRLYSILPDMVPQQKLVLALDPDQIKAAESMAAQLGESAYVADFSCKPDDFYLRYGSNAYAKVIKQARRVKAAK